MSASIPCGYAITRSALTKMSTCNLTYPSVSITHLVVVMVTLLPITSSPIPQSLLYGAT